MIRADELTILGTNRRNSAEVPLSNKQTSSLQNRDLSQRLMQRFCHVHGLLSGGTSVVFMWVSSQVGLAEN